MRKEAAEAKRDLIRVGKYCYNPKENDYNFFSCFDECLLSRYG